MIVDSFTMKNHQCTNPPIDGPEGARNVSSYMTAISMKSLLFLLLLTLGSFLHSQAISPDRIEQLNSYLQDQIEQKKYVGVYILIEQNDTLLVSRGYGKKDIEINASPSEITMFRMASMSKPIAAVAVLKVCEDMGISLNTPVSSYLKMVTDKNVTLRQMLSQTSGWGDWWNANDHAETYKRITSVDYNDIDSFVEDYLKLPQIEAPGTGWFYGYSMDVLVLWLEQITGRKFVNYVREEIFEPLGMVNSSYDFPNNPDCAYYHEKNESGEWEKKFTPLSNMYPGSGSLVSNASDYFKFCKMIINGGKYNGKQILSSNMINEMLTVHIGEDGDIIPWQNGYGYALGVSVRVNDALAKMGGTLGDYGWFGFYGTSFWIDPAREIIGIILSQRPYDGYQLTHEVRNIIYDHK